MQPREIHLFMDDPDLWKSDSWLRHLEELLPHKELVSFDIFDTLLFRACSEPAGVFVLTGEKAIIDGAFYRPLSPHEFRSIRIQAEQKARDKQRKATGFGEVTLAQIYEEMPLSLGKLKRIMQVELELEQEVCYLNPNVTSLLLWCKAHGKKVALLSDMYLDSEQIFSILASAGLDLSAVDLLLVSCEEQCGKSSGKLFDKLMEQYPQIQAHAMVHIGDNFTADVEGATSRSIASVHYQVIPENFQSHYHWETIRHGDMLPQLRSLRKLAGSSGTLTYSGSEEEQAFYRIGAEIIGPFLTALCEWVIDVCVQENLKEVHPLMREAYLLGPMLEQAAAMRGFNLQVKPLYVSRQATFLASMERFGPEELDGLFQLNWVKVGDLFEVLDIREESASFAQYGDTPLTECKLLKSQTGETVVDRLRQFLLSDAILEKVTHSIERHRQLFIEYLLQECGSLKRIITVDIGFNGTIQKSLEAILKLAGQQHQPIHLMAVGSDKAAGLLLRGMDVRCLIGSGGPNGYLGKRIARSPAFLEELMMGAFGSTLRHERNSGGKIVPVLAPLHHADSEFACKLACQEGVFAFQRYHHYFRQVKPGILSDAAQDPGEWCKPLHRLIDMPMPEEARRLGDLTHQDNFCGEQIAMICEPVEEKWLERGGEAFLDSCNFGPNILNVFWPQGVLTRKYPMYLYRYYLRLHDHFGNRSMLFEMMMKLQLEGIASIQVYGTGPFAETVMRSAGFYGIKVDALVDPGTDPVSPPWSSVPIRTLEQAIHQGNHIYVLATLSDMALYCQQIEQAYQLRKDVQPRLFELFV